jgi:hypothetical protein
MNMEKTEKKLKQLFSESKERDSQRMPPFNSVARASLRDASTPRTLLRWPRFALFGVAAVLLIAGVAVISSRIHTRSFEKEMHQWAALSNWEAPTDALLSVSETPWGNTTTGPSDFPTNDDVSTDTNTKQL